MKSQIDNLSQLLGIQDNSSADSQIINNLEHIPFYCEWTYGRRLSINDCCFNHIIGLPTDAITAEPKELYQWQYDYIIKNLERYKLNWLKKATGIGASELTLRWILYQCLTNEQWKHGIVCILTGPNWDLAKRLIARAYNMIVGHIPLRKVTDTKLIINNVEVCSFPSHNLSGMRSLTNVRFILLDEADYFGTLMQQEEVRTVVERYRGKTDCSIFMVSTPKDPDGLFARMEQEDTNYNKIFIDYTIPLGTLFTQEQINKARKLPSFPREYENKYVGLEGNTFRHEDLQIAMNEDYSLDPHEIESISYPRFMGIDPAFGSSSFAITITMFKDDMIYVVYSDEFERALYPQMVDLVRQLIARFHIQKIYIDAANPSVIKNLIAEYEPSMINYHELPPEYIKRFIHSAARSPLFVPIAFNKYHTQLLQQTQKILGLQKVKIHKSFTKLHVALRSAQSREYNLLKDKTSHDDSLDSFMLALLRVQWK